MTVIDPVISISGLGAVRGQVDNKAPVARFLNLPYATVTKRWSSATPATKPWEGIRDGTVQGPQAPQQSKRSGIIPVLRKLAGQFEYHDTCNERDSLNINIYAPSITIEEANTTITSNIEKIVPLPVLVWIHGGSFKRGSNGLGLYGKKEGGPPFSFPLPNITFKTTTIVLAKAILIKRI